MILQVKVPKLHCEPQHIAMFYNTNFSVWLKHKNYNRSQPLSNVTVLFNDITLCVADLLDLIAVMDSTDLMQLSSVQVFFVLYTNLSGLYHVISILCHKYFMPYYALISGETTALNRNTECEK